MSKEKKRLEDVVLTIKHLTTGLSDALELFEMAKEEDDDASLEAVETDISSLKKRSNISNSSACSIRNMTRLTASWKFSRRRRNRSAGLGQHA